MKSEAPEVAPVTCPYCGGTLYLAKRRDEADRMLWIASAGTPQIKTDADGVYLTCQHCFKRISIRVIRESAEGMTLEVLPHQPFLRRQGP
jgi:hypothetical protein